MSSETAKIVSQKIKEHPNIARKVRLVLLAAALIFLMHFGKKLLDELKVKCFGVVKAYGICSEDKFKYDYIHLLVINLIIAVVAKVVLVLKNKMLNQDDRGKTSILWYTIIAASMVLSIVLNTLVWNSHSYDAFSLTSALKPLFAIISCSFLSKINYKIQRYFFIIFIGIGLYLFEFETRSESSGVLGYLSAVVSLIFYGIMYGLIEHVRKTTKPTALDLMMWINLLSAPMLLVAAFINIEIVKFLNFLVDHHAALLEIFKISIIMCAAAYIEYSIVINNGAVTAAIVNATCLFFGFFISKLNSTNTELTGTLKPLDIFGSIIVVTGLLADLVISDWSCQKCENETNQNVELGDLSGNKTEADVA